MDLAEKIKKFPTKPGVYLMKNASGKVVYVGKAVNLRSRVANYFGKGRDTRYQIDALMKKTVDVEYIVTSTEKEALLLEYNLIQEHKPHYNVIFKDSKRYVSVKLSSYHRFPGIYVTRQTPRDGSTYFGPYTSAASCREVVELITSYFKIRICSDTFFANRSRPCIQYEIGRCTAPCVGYVSEEEYLRQVEAAEMFLKGNVSELTKVLKRQMSQASKEMRYEEAAHLRDVLNNIEVMVEPQAVSGFRQVNKDYVGMYHEGGRCTFAILKLRQGKIRGYESVLLKDQLGEVDSLWEQFLLQYYRKPEKIPGEIIVDHESESVKALQSLVQDRKEGQVKIRKPLRGTDLKRLRMAKSNARETFYQRHREREWDLISETLMKKLRLSEPPSTVECVDISNISGKFAVGSIVAFSEGVPDKSSYRRYKIKTTETPDDYAMMFEVLSRRFKLGPSGPVAAGPPAGVVTSSEEPSAPPVIPAPDLLLIDGGKGQLMIAKRVLDELGITGTGLAAIAKGKDRKQDQIFIPGRKNPVAMKGGPAHLFLQRVRDEAHRFGIEYYRKRHRKELVTSELDTVPGIGPAKRKALLKRFGSVEKIAKASPEDLVQTPGISPHLAAEILSHLRTT